MPKLKVKCKTELECTVQVEGKQAYGRLSYLGGEVMKRLRGRGRKPPMGGFARSKK